MQRDEKPAAATQRGMQSGADAPAVPRPPPPQVN